MHIQSKGWAWKHCVTKAHEDEGSHDHDDGLQGVCVDHCSQPTWKNTSSAHFTVLTHTLYTVLCIGLYAGGEKVVVKAIPRSYQARQVRWIRQPVFDPRGESICQVAEEDDACFDLKRGKKCQDKSVCWGLESDSRHTFMGPVPSGSGLAPTQYQAGGHSLMPDQFQGKQFPSYCSRWVINHNNTAQINKPGDECVQIVARKTLPPVMVLFMQQEDKTCVFLTGLKQMQLAETNLWRCTRQWSIKGQ